MATLTAAGVNFSDGTTINGTTTNTIGSLIIAGNPIEGTGSKYTGSTCAGSQLRTGYVGSNVYANTINPSLTGTWRRLGFSFSSSDCNGVYSTQTLFVRIS